METTLSAIRTTESLLGQFLIHCNIMIVVAAIGFSLTTHRQILREEKFLSSNYGGEHEAYRKKVRRYL